MTSMMLDQWRVCPDENRLYRGQRQVDLQPRCMHLLACLAHRPEQVVTRDELLETVWNGRVVGEDAINNCVRKLRLALGDDPRNPRLIETIQRRGYRLMVPVRPVRHRWSRSRLAIALTALAITVFIVHSDVTVYRFSDADTPEQRQAKLEQMAGDIERRGDDAHSVSIKTPI